MMKYKKQILLFFSLAILSLAFFIRLNNLFVFNSYWADDGGAHIGYIQTIAEEQRLPSSEENYLAWHEPGYYALMAPVWNLAKALNTNPVQVIVFLQMIIFACTLFVSYKIPQKIVPNNKFVHAAVPIALAFQFTGVKFSGFVTNELFAQFWILLLVYLALRWNILEQFNRKKFLYWSVLVGIGMWIKLTIILPVLIVGVVWFIQLLKQKKVWPVYAVLIVGVIVGAIYSPWLSYKSQKIGPALTINNYEHENKQSLLTSNGWNHLTHVNVFPFIHVPYWMGERVHSFWSMLAADMMGDYYWLFGHQDSHNGLSEELSVRLGSGKRVSEQQWTRATLANRAGIALLLFWIIGFFGYLWNTRKTLLKTPSELVLIVSPLAALSALIYNLLRFPYLERGIVKFHFVYFGLVFLLIGSFAFWEKTIQKKWLLWLIVFGSLGIYIFFSWNVLLVTPAFY